MSTNSLGNHDITEVLSIPWDPYMLTDDQLATASAITDGTDKWQRPPTVSAV